MPAKPLRRTEQRNDTPPRQTALRNDTPPKRAELRNDTPLLACGDSEHLARSTAID